MTIAFLVQRSAASCFVWCCGIFVLSNLTAAHDGPDPLAHWRFNERHISDSTLQARLGPNGVFTTKPLIVPDPYGQSIAFDGDHRGCLLAENFHSARAFLPTREMTIAAWVGVDRPSEWGGIIGVLPDNGSAEKGWILGYDESVFYFGLSTTGADDGDGQMTYLRGKTNHESGKLFHVVGVYDGSTMQLYVNGKLEAESPLQSGEILYPDAAPWLIGAYRDRNEFEPLQGRIREVAVYDLAAKAKWIAHDFSHQEDLANLKIAAPATELQFKVQPFLQYGTMSGMTVVWQTTIESRGTLFWGEDAACSNKIAGADAAKIQQIRIEDLRPETQYFYRVESEREGRTIASEPATFQTASKRGTPVTFAVISDTQKNLKVAGQAAQLAWAHRPHFLLLPGDLVDQGKRDADWLTEFFPALNVLISRVPLFPVLGNHEENAQNYFDYMALPDPEYYYSFSYGDADFFMIDSNRNVDPDSEQYQWLEQQLAASTAIWKFVCHHHPPYSSDEDDYGDLWKTNRGTYGDLRVRKLVPLYEKYGVDIVWTGHIHSYERTWPIKDNQAVNVGGTIYMITGGGGGNLETPGPYRPFFQNNVRRGHHYTMVHINGKKLELKAFSIDDQLFDYTEIEKK